MNFNIDERLLSNSIELADWELSKVLFKNEENYAWFLLIPQRENLKEITDLTEDEQKVLMSEINHLAKIIKKEFKADKINIASIGNIVPQLHVHVLGRFKDDPLWPESLWQSRYSPQAYEEKALKDLISKLKKVFGSKYQSENAT